LPGTHGTKRGDISEKKSQQEKAQEAFGRPKLGASRNKIRVILKGPPKEETSLDFDTATLVHLGQEPKEKMAEILKLKEENDRLEVIQKLHKRLIERNCGGISRTSSSFLEPVLEEIRAKSF
jgi:hypothetical protein